MTILKTGRILRPAPPGQEQPLASSPQLRQQVAQEVSSQVDATTLALAQQAREAAQKKAAEHQARIRSQVDYMRRGTGQDAGGKISRAMAAAGRVLPEPGELYGLGMSPPPRPSRPHKKKS